ncbi:MAG TPA: anti-sigma factor, partial [Methylotenera sp.]|nr:anti-sigma factor [Methylotenera sp.]
MRYDNRLLADMLATEYILGALKGAARRRFEQLLTQRADLAQTFHWWESHLHLLADTVPATPPSNKVWQNIENRLFNAPRTNSQSNNSSWWKGLAFLSTAMAVSLATFLAIQSPKQLDDNAPTAVALLTTEKAEAGWLLDETKHSPTNIEIKVRALTGLQIKPDNAFELWLLPADKSKPISLGLLPQQGTSAFKVPEELIPQMATGLLAVSLEPVGGSPTGQPTGAVLYQGRMTKT